MNYKLRFEETLKKRSSVIVSLKDGIDIENILDIADDGHCDNAEDYMFELEKLGLTIVKVVEDEIEHYEFECTDLVKQ